MAQINFIATRKDSLEILEAIAEIRNTLFTIDKLFDSESCGDQLWRGPVAIQQRCNTAQRVFFWSTDTFQNEPKLWRIPDGDDAGKYCIRQAENETIFGFSSFDMTCQLNKHRICPGMIDWDDRWHDRSDGKMKPLKAPSKQLISSVRSIVNKKMTRVIFRESILVGREAMRLYQNGEATLVCYGKEFSTSSA